MSSPCLLPSIHLAPPHPCRVPPRQDRAGEREVRGRPWAVCCGVPTSKCGPQKVEGIQEQEVGKPWVSSVEITWVMGEVTWAAKRGTDSSFICCRAWPE